MGGLKLLCEVTKTISSENYTVPQLPAIFCDQDGLRSIWVLSFWCGRVYLESLDFRLEWVCQWLLGNKCVCRHARSPTPPAVVSVGGKEWRQAPGPNGPQTWNSSPGVFSIGSRSTDCFLVSLRCLYPRRCQRKTLGILFPAIFLSGPI